MTQRLALLLASSLCATSLHAGVVYNLRDSRYFPSAATPFTITASTAFTSTTSASLPDSYSSNPGSPSSDTFDGNATVNGSPFTLGTQNSVTLNTDTTDYQNLGLLSIVQSGIDDSSVTITGGSGTGYFLPVFHVFGTESNSNPNAVVSDNICAGNGTCLLSSVFGNFTSGVHSVDGFYSPSIGADTSFQFGTPFNFFFFFGSGIQGSGAAGGTTTADLTLQWAGFQVVSVDGRAIPGVQVHSDFLGAITPEPGTAGTLAAAAVLLGLLGRKRSPHRKA